MCYMEFSESNGIFISAGISHCRCLYLTLKPLSGKAKPRPKLHFLSQLWLRPVWLHQIGAERHIIHPWTAPDNEVRDILKFPLEFSMRSILCLSNFLSVIPLCNNLWPTLCARVEQLDSYFRKECLNVVSVHASLILRWSKGTLF